MTIGTIEATYRRTVRQIRTTLAEQRKWQGMPALLDELQRLRALASALKSPPAACL